MHLILAAVLVIVGLAGIVIPGVPGPILIFAGLAVAAWADGFTRVGPLTPVVIGLLTVTTYLIDIAVMAMGMKRLGTTKRAMVGAALGTFAGFFMGLPGLVIGPFAGAVLGELSARRDARTAARAGVLAWVGYLAGTSAKVALAFAMVGIFLAAWFVV
jgi:uncharacterized protein YqgC (DUF456 family)